MSPVWPHTGPFLVGQWSRLWLRGRGAAGCSLWAPCAARGCLTSSISLFRRMLLAVLSTSLQGSSSAPVGPPSQPRCPSPAGSSHPMGRSSSWSGWGQREVSIPAGLREQQLPNPPSVGCLPSLSRGRERRFTGMGTSLSPQSSSRLPAAPDSPGAMPCCAVPCHAVPCHAPAPCQVVPPRHTELQGCMATRGGGRGGEEGTGKEGKEGFCSCSPRRRGEALSFPYSPTARLTPQRGRGGGCAAVLVATSDKCLSQPRAQDGCGCMPRAGGQQLPAHCPQRPRGVSECSPGTQEI